VGRAPAFWTEENARLIREHFVAVSVSNIDQGRQDAVGQFFRDAGMKLPGAGGSQWAVTARGKVLLSNNANGLGFHVPKALAAWNALPAAERAPGAVQVGELGEIDTERAPPGPPEGGLILKVYYRAFMRDKAGRLRYVTGQDLWHDETGNRTEARFDVQYPGRLTTPQAQPDHMWLTEAESKSLIPEAPRQGDRFPMPEGIANRLVRWHLNPLLVYGETNALSPKAVRGGELMLSVDAVSDASLRLRIEGFAQLGEQGDEPPPTVLEGTCAAIGPWGYEPRLLGYIEFDRQQSAVTRFDLVALGNHFGRLGIADSGSRPGVQPLGISFELVTGDAPADRIPPGRAPTAKNYFR
jgi:hypothetical protein